MLRGRNVHSRLLKETPSQMGLLFVNGATAAGAWIGGTRCRRNVRVAWGCEQLAAQHLRSEHLHLFGGHRLGPTVGSAVLREEAGQESCLERRRAADGRDDGNGTRRSAPNFRGAPCSPFSSFDLVFGFQAV